MRNPGLNHERSCKFFQVFFLCVFFVARFEIHIMFFQEETCGVSKICEDGAAAVVKIQPPRCEMI